MPRVDIDAHYRPIQALVKDIQQFAPADNIQTIGFRSHLAGLLVVSIAATYENCVKETLVSYASTHGRPFEDFVTNHYDRLSSRIKVDDLRHYARAFNQSIHRKFNVLLKERKERVTKATGQNIEQKYKLVLDWRHDFAHAGNSNTTIEEAFDTHRFAKHILYSFDEAFNGR